MTNDTAALPIWAALSDPKRRQILQLLKEKACTTSELCTHFDVSRFAVMKHLNVLEEAGLILVERKGRQRWNLLNEATLQRLRGHHLADEVGLTALQQMPPVGAEPRHIALSVALPALPAEVFQALTADIDAWWPQREVAASQMVLEPVVNGRFYERFDDAGHGALLGVITLIKPGEQICFSGPFGIADKAAISTVVWSLEAAVHGTTLYVQHALIGEVDAFTQDAFANWWRDLLNHYLVRHLMQAVALSAG